jgi:undecaprenyl-diphosphatase
VALALRQDLRALDHQDVRRLLASSLPAAAAGALAHGAVERRLGRPGPTAALLAASGLLLLAADARSASRSAEPSDVTAAGLAQVGALVPGVSRSGATLTALRARGVDRQAAVRLSLLMSLPVTGGAAALTAVRARQAPAPVPTLLAAASAYAVTRRLRPSRAWVAGSVLYRLGVAAAVGARLRKERA